MKSRHQRNVDKVYGKLTEEQLEEQRDKFKGSKTKHELGKYVRSVQEINKRRSDNE